ncbi:hypothetical protein GCM10011331_22650 [Flavimobilis marinus]|nr:hypothetical protein GCM10011331_22650 [Flavimobilis marinus]
MTDMTRNELIEAHLPLIGYHVSEMLSRVPSHVSRDDLASAGALALVKAADAYDPATGVPFNRYAAIRIRGALVDELRSMDWASRGTRTRLRKMTSAADELTAKLGHAPSREQLASALGVSVEDVEAAQEDASRRVLSIEGYDGAVADILPDRDPSPEEAVLIDERLRYLKGAVAALPERLRVVVEQVFFHDRPVTDVAAELGVTQSRVSQLRAEAMLLLRDGMNAHLDPAQVVTAEKPGGVADRRRQAYYESVGVEAHALATVSVLPSADAATREVARTATTAAVAATVTATAMATAAYAVSLSRVTPNEAPVEGAAALA